LEKQKSIFIIATELDDQIENTQRFLQARGWKVDVFAGPLNRALQIAVTVNCDYLFVSLESLPPNYNELHSALRKSFRAILYSEKLSLGTLKALQNLGASDVLTSSLSGPTVERLVQRMEREDILPPRQKLAMDRPQDASHIDINRLAKATEVALGNVCQMNLSPRKALGNPSKFYTFALQTPRIDGYIVVASAGDMPADFVQRLKRQIMDSMTLQNDFLRVGEIHSIEVQEVSFEGLAINVGEFFNKSIHLGNEIAISFFRVPQIDIPIADSPMENSISARLNEISPRVPLEFDIFVYMPLNKKFVQYRRAGEYLEQDQRKSLEFHGIDEVHLKKDSLIALHRHKARSYISSLILGYRADITELTAA
jgi:hypothetical protein